MCRTTSRRNRPRTKRSPARPAWTRFPAPLLSSCGRTAWVGSSCRRGSWTGRCRLITSRSSRRSTNSLYKQQTSPVFKHWKDTPATSWRRWATRKFPYVLTTYRLTEHYLAGGMSRWLPWLTELQPELFVEISPELAQEKGIKNLDWCRISSPRTQIRAKALVTRRMRPFNIDGKVIHQVGMPWHWGYEGLSTGDVVNELTSLIADPNVSMHEGKAFVCNVEKA